jgi:hypothetical protein
MLALKRKIRQNKLKRSLKEKMKKDNNISKKILEQKKLIKIKEEAGAKFKQYIGAGFGLVAGLAWNDAIKGAIEYLFPLEKNSLTAKFIYAITMTLIVVVIGISLSKIFRQESKK